ncbi:P-loop containing nucleoside triphosphate hydrolase protein [Dichotomocladium elegans]|nr:P-loop containing nucleoside triphosphate hydrolase protein [Dichotomocladium elegans]
MSEASIYSRLMFSWMLEMMKTGYRHTLNDEDLEELPPKDLSKNILLRYDKCRSRSLIYSLVKTFRKEYLLLFCFSMGLLGLPFMLFTIIQFIESPNSEEPTLNVYIYTFLLLILGILEALSNQQILHYIRTIEAYTKTIVVGEVLRKSLRCRDRGVALASDNKSTSSINNLVSNDADTVASIGNLISILYTNPLRMVLSLGALYLIVGTAAIWGVLVSLAIQPVIFYSSKLFRTVYMRTMSASDKRLEVMQEMLSSIRIIKFFAWEDQFRKRVQDARAEELKAVRNQLCMFTLIWNTFLIPSFLFMATVLYFYTRDQALTAATGFTVLTLFIVLRNAMDEYPTLVARFLSARVSAKRIEAFLYEQDEVTPVVEFCHQIGFADNATFGWERCPYKAIVKNLNVVFPRHKLSIIIGPTGSGKSTLLASLLGETYCWQGRSMLPVNQNQNEASTGPVSGIAYVAQNAWIQNRSIRDNILFGLPYNAERYEQTLYATSLAMDLNTFEYGDLTEVGERGITLSGGQKQRIALARAVYSQAEIVILDDCLSAVDAHTAKHLYEHCIRGKLMHNRTVLLVTHHVALCIEKASFIVAMKDGQIAKAGDPAMILASGVLGEEFIRDGNCRDNESHAGPRHDDSKTVKAKKIPNKLIKDEEREEGSVTLSVYNAYIRAAGGYSLWVLILVMFGLAQASFFGQDYWLKVWASEYYNELYPTIQSTQSLHQHKTVLTEQTHAKFYLLIYIILSVVPILISTGRAFIVYAGSLTASRRLHDQMLDRILNGKARFFDTTPVGRIINRFSGDLRTIDSNISMGLSNILYMSARLICIVLLVSISLPVFIIPGIIIALLNWRVARFYLASSRELKRLFSVSRSPIYALFHETLEGSTTIRAFGAQHRFLIENDTCVDNNNRSFLWMWGSNRWLHANVGILGTLVGFFTSLVIISARTWIEPGLSALTLTYSLLFTESMLWIIRTYAENEMNMNSVERVMQYLKIDQEPLASRREITLPALWPSQGVVQVQDLEVRYAADSPAVLHHFSFTTQPHEKVGIVGRTGSGKSTFALALFRFMEPMGGRILIDGIDINHVGVRDLRSRLTIIPQDPILFSGTLRSNLDPCGLYDDQHLWAALRRSHLLESIMESGAQNGEHIHMSSLLDSAVHGQGTNWSQGQRQLIALARALLKKSKVIVFDEATSSVDFSTDKKIQETIRTEFVDATLLVIAHRVRTVVDYDRILVIDEGRVKEFDTPLNLLARQDSVFRDMCRKSGELDVLLASTSSN